MITPIRYCTVCKNRIALKRITRGSFYCTANCRDKAKNEMRYYKAQKACRLCGRPPLKPRRPRQAATLCRPELANNRPRLPEAETMADLRLKFGRSVLSRTQSCATDPILTDQKHLDQRPENEPIQQRFRSRHEALGREASD